MASPLHLLSGHYFLWRATFRDAVAEADYRSSDLGAGSGGDWNNCDCQGVAWQFYFWILCSAHSGLHAAWLSLLATLPALDPGCADLSGRLFPLGRRVSRRLAHGHLPAATQGES